MGFYIIAERSPRVDGGLREDVRSACVRGKAFGFLGILLLLGSGGCPHADQSPAKSATRLDLAKDFLHKHQLEAAESECNRALAYDSSNEEAYLVRGLVQFTRAFDAKSRMETQTCLTGVDADAVRRDVDGFLNKADADFTKAAELAPDYGEAWADRGVVHTLLDDPQPAIEYLTKALENPMRLINPTATRADLGWAYFNEKKYVDAAKELAQARQFQPKMCLATYRLARVYFAREEWEKAAELFQGDSDDSACGSQEASLYLMRTRLQQGLVDDAQRARDACLKLSPQSCDANSCRAEGAALGAEAP
jgi:Tfp pilus assembly protein PilF